MYKRIMVPLDGSKLAECVLPHLENIIKGCRPSEVVVVRAVEPISVPYGRGVSQFTSLEQVKEFEARQKVEAEKYLKKIVARLSKAGIRVKVDVIYGKAVEVFSGYIAKNKVDLVVMATHGRSGIKRLVWGSVAGQLLRSVHVPILMVRPRGYVPDA